MYNRQFQVGLRRLSWTVTEETRLDERQTAALRLQMRQRAATLLEAVLDETITPQMAFNRWPDHPLIADPSLETALKALWYFEGDEDLHRTEMFYLDTQMELLRQMWRHLREGRDLPRHLLGQYAEDLSVRYFYPSENPWQVLWRDAGLACRRFCGLFRQTLSTALRR